MDMIFSMIQTTSTGERLQNVEMQEGDIICILFHKRRVYVFIGIPLLDGQDHIICRRKSE